MKDVFPWVPFGIDAPDGAKTGRLVLQGEGFQLVQDQGTDRFILLSPDKANFAIHLSEIIPNTEQCERVGTINLFDTLYHAVTFSEDNCPVKVANMPQETTLRSAMELLELAKAISSIETNGGDFEWGEAIYFPEQGKCIPTKEGSDGEERHALAIKLLTGGIKDTSLSIAQIHAANHWISIGEIQEFLELLELRVPTDERRVIGAPRPPAQFTLPGRQALEEFFREYVIDHFWQKDRYDALGVKPPGGILLSGPPGTGKTFAVRELSKFLGWPFFDINMGSIGSPYIH